MSTVIYQASKDENGKYKNGKAGDQTGQEVYSRSWYSRPWTQVYEPPTDEAGAKCAKTAKEACANNNIGYDQNQRNTLHTLAKKVNYDMTKITTACECDCSSLATDCAIASGASESIMIQSGNAATSSTIGERLKKCGWKEHTESKYLTSSDYLGKGWILVYKGHHVAINGTNGTKYNGGSSSANSSSNGSGCPYTEPTATIKEGDTGTGVSWLQWHLNTLIDKKILTGTKLTVDGEWGTKTSTIFKAFQTKYPSTGTNGKPDGKCGSGSRKQLKSLV
jgi:hypothetical protein